MITIVVDRPGGGRSSALGTALAGGGSQVYVIDSRGAHRYPDLGERDHLPSRVELVLVHRSDWDLWENQDVEAGLVVRYSGGGAPVSHPEEEFWIQRPINLSEDALSIEEAKEIIQWARDNLDGEAKLKLPPVLKRRQSFRVLPALAILCQGYLAVHGDPEKREPDLSYEEEGARALVRRAQEEMGWYHIDSEILDTRVREPESRRELQKEVQDPSWWLEPFGEDCLFTSVQEELGGHGESAARVRALVDTLKRRERVSPGEVAACFLTLHEILGKV